MGALTDLIDRRNDEEGYHIAKTIYTASRTLSSKQLEKEFRSIDYRYDDNFERWEMLFWDVEKWYRRFAGKEIQKYFILYEWNLTPVGAELLKEIVRKCG